MYDGESAATRGDVMETIRAHLGSRDTPREAITDEASFVTDLGADSLDLQTLAHELEDEYGIAIGPHDAAGLQTVGETADFVMRGRAGETS